MPINEKGDNKGKNEKFFKDDGGKVREIVNEVKKTLPELRSVIERRLKKEGLTEDMLSILFKQNKISEFKEINNAVMMPKLVGKILLLLPKELASKTGVDLEKVEEILTTDVLIFVLESLKNGKIEEGDLKVVLEKIINGESVGEAIKIEKADLDDMENKVKEIIESKDYLKIESFDQTKSDIYKNYNSMPNLLIHGSAGCGKHTLIKLLLESLIVIVG